jgi:Uma2 family endonuclease
VTAASPLHPQAPLEPRRLSLDEWAALGEDEPGELVDGRLVEEEVADWDHEAVVAWLLVVVGAWVLARDGWIFGSDGKFALRAGLGRKPDLSIFLPGRAPPPRRGPGRSPPDVAVEVISSTTRDARRDRIDKATEYAAFGVRYYWLVDPDDRTFEVFELDPQGRYARALGAASGAVEVPGCDGLRLDLDALWAKIDTLA